MSRTKKNGVEGTVTQQADVDIEKLIAENANLKQTIAELGNVGDGDPAAMKYMNEVANIKRSGRVDAEKIKVREFADHKNISLWTKWGKRVGPLHRDNALATLQNFFNKGVMLTTKPPTAEEVEAWKNSPEGKKWIDAVKAKRELNAKSLKRGQMEKIMKLMADQFGLTREALMSIKKSNEVMSPAEGRKVLES